MMLPLRIKLEVPVEEIYVDEFTEKHVELCNVGELYINCGDGLHPDTDNSEAGLSKGSWHNIKTYTRRCQKLLPDATGKPTPQVIRLWQDKVQTSFPDKEDVSVLSEGLVACENGLGPETDITEPWLSKGHWRNIRTSTCSDQSTVSNGANKQGPQVIRLWQDGSSTSFLDNDVTAPDTRHICCNTMAFTNCDNGLLLDNVGTQTGCWRKARTYTRTCQQQLSNATDKPAPQDSRMFQKNDSSIVNDSTKSEGLDDCEIGLCPDTDTTETVLPETCWHNIKTYARCQSLTSNATSKPAVQMDLDESPTSCPGRPTARTSVLSEGLDDLGVSYKQKSMPNETSAPVPFPMKVQPAVFVGQPEGVTLFGEVRLAALQLSLKQGVAVDSTRSNTQDVNVEHDNIVCKRQLIKSEILEQRGLSLSERIVQYRAADAERKREKRMNESPEKRARRLAIDAARKRMQRASCTGTQERRDLCIEAFKLHFETPEEAQRRRQVQAERMRRKRMMETPEEKQCRRAVQAHQARLRRMAETPQQAARRRADQAERARFRRLRETPTEADRRKKADAERARVRRLSETVEQRQRRLIAQAERIRLKRLATTFKAVLQ